MRRFLVDPARGLSRAKRGAAAAQLPLDEDLVFSPAKSAAAAARIYVTLADGGDVVVKVLPPRFARDPGRRTLPGDCVSVFAEVEVRSEPQQRNRDAHGLAGVDS